jgi:glyoxylase-like metal-dependent hydrolase (beta-lactamase superfamily II)
MKPQVTAFFDKTTFTVSYVVADVAIRRCAVIDSVLDYNASSGCTGTASADRIVAFIDEQSLQTEWILETHVHADHLSAAPYLKQKLSGKLGIGEHISEVQQVFSGIFNTEPGFCTHGSQFDHLFKDEEAFAIGSLQARALHTPGHTPACMTYLIGDAAFVGDTLFMPDYGTARCDFPGGDARQLYRSIRRIFDLPGATRLFMCHDYAPNGREYLWETTVAEQRSSNVHIHDGVSEDAFVKMRSERDATLDMPKLMLPSVQVNMRAGEMPPVETNGRRYLKIPLNAF